MNVLLKSKCIQASVGKEMKKLSNKAMAGICMLVEENGELSVYFYENAGLAVKTAAYAVDYADILVDAAKLAGNVGSMAFRFATAMATGGRAADSIAMKYTWEAMKENWGDLKTDLSIQKECGGIDKDELINFRFRCMFYPSSRIYYGTTGPNGKQNNVICIKHCWVTDQNDKGKLTSCMFYLESKAQVSDWYAKIRAHVPGIFMQELNSGAGI